MSDTVTDILGEPSDKVSFNIFSPSEKKMSPERLSKLFKVTQLVRSIVKLPTPKPTVFSLNVATKNQCSLQLPWGERQRSVRRWGWEFYYLSFLIILEQKVRENQSRCQRS